MNDFQVTEINPQDVQIIDSVEKANVDIQVSTAKRYPRDITRATNNAIAMVTMDQETAQSCSYALPRGGKIITGPSVHFAKIIVSNWGNLRTEARVVQITDSQIVSRGVAWDLENNVASAFEVRRSIKGKSGRFNDDMITVTGNAANSIAYRNAVLSVIPKTVTDRVYKAAQGLITGDLSDDAKLAARRQKAVDYFRDEWGITEQEVIKLVGKQTFNQIKAEEIATLIGIQQSLKDGDTNVDDLMEPFRRKKKEVGERKSEMKNKKAAELP